MTLTLLRSSFILSCVLFAAPSTALAQDWPNWRGPRWDGSSPATGLPAEFDQEKNVRWATDMPGPGASTPIVVGDRIFLTSVDAERERLVALCVNRTDGSVLWQKDADSGYQPGGAGSRTALGYRSNYASPSAVTDGERVVFFFGNGDLVAYDLDGEELWRRNIQKDYGDFAFQWTFSATPTMWEGLLFLPVLQRDVPVAKSRGGAGGRGRRRRRGPDADPLPVQDPAEDSAEPILSFVLAMDPTTGKNVYQHVRPAPARMESLEAYTTMIPYIGAGGRKELLLIGGDVLTGHDPATGKELWRWGTWNEAHRRRDWRIVPSAVIGDGVALVCAPKGAPVYAVPLGKNGELEQDAFVWKSDGRPNPVSSDVATPAFDDGHFYVLNDRSALSKVAAKDGAVVWTTAMPKDYLWRASPTVADGRVWCINHNGEVIVLDAAKGEIVHRAQMGSGDDDLIRSTLVVAHGCLFVRTNSKLFCVGAE